VSAQKNHAVLIVEDELIVARDLQQTLNRMGYDAFGIASSAEEAIAIASDRRPDVVLMDIRIKGELDGIQSASILRERFDVPVVYLTAYTDEATIGRVKKTSPYGYLSKPVKSGELRSVIEIALYKRNLEAAQERAEELEAERTALLKAADLKDAFLSNMSHELRTPLNGLIGFAQLMRDGMGGALSERQREFLDQVLISGQRFVDLVEKVLDLANYEAGAIELKPERIDLRALVEEIVARLRPANAAEGHPMEVLIEPACAQVVNDRVGLRQIVYAYLSNAVKFTPKGGSIRFRAAREAPDCLKIEVTDTGSGISPDDAVRLFVPFQQLDWGIRRKFEGAGLGLALAKRIAEYQGGRVGYQNVAGGGNCFFAVLPLFRNDSPQRTSGASPASM
jgi:signal transduction histidine kinase